MKYYGRIPVTEGWSHVASIDTPTEGSWGVYARPRDSGWTDYKVVFLGKTESKANYWLAKEQATGRLAAGKDLATMKRYRGELYDTVLELLAKV